MEACVLAISLQGILGKAAFQSDRARPSDFGIAAGSAIAGCRTSRQLRSRCYGTPQIPSGEGCVPDATVNGGVVHYEAAGKGPPLVLLHGIGSNSRSWSRQLATLSTDFKVVAWDAPGYGRSSDPPSIAPSMRFYAESLRGLLETLDLRKIFLLGHSTGGVIAQEFHRLFPNFI